MDAMDTSGSLKYTRLRGADVRLLKFEKSIDDNDRVHLSPHAYDRDETPPYAAISYTWGLEAATEPIFLNGESFFVRPNLYDCLLSLRRHSRIDAFSIGPDKRDNCYWSYVPGEGQQLSNQRRCHYIWIDVICIDQPNLEERNNEVTFMDQTFGKAEMVAVWLGRWADRQQDGLTKISSMEATHLQWTFQATTLLNHPYWSRMWIVRELLMARHIMLFCGPYHLSWTQLARIAGGAGGSSGVKVAQQKTAAFPFFQEGLGRKSSPDRNLERYLATYAFSICCDRRDRVFSLLGLLPDEERMRIAGVLPEYSLTQEQVVRIALRHIQRTRAEHSIKEAPDQILRRALVVDSTDKWTELCRDTAAFY